MLLRDCGCSRGLTRPLALLPSSAGQDGDLARLMKITCQVCAAQSQAPGMTYEEVVASSHSSVILANIDLDPGLGVSLDCAQLTLKSVEDKCEAARATQCVAIDPVETGVLLPPPHVHSLQLQGNECHLLFFS